MPCLNSPRLTFTDIGYIDYNKRLSCHRVRQLTDLARQNISSGYLNELNMTAYRFIAIHKVEAHSDHLLQCSTWWLICGCTLHATEELHCYSVALSSTGCNTPCSQHCYCNGIASSCRVSVAAVRVRRQVSDAPVPLPLLYHPALQRHTPPVTASVVVLEGAHVPESAACTTICEHF